MSSATAPVRQHHNVTLAVLALGALSYALLQTMVAPALPEIQHELGATPTQVTWVLTVYLLSASIATPILGRLGDMFGKERMLVVVLGLFAVGLADLRRCPAASSCWSRAARCRARPARCSRSRSGSSATSSRATAWPRASASSPPPSASAAAPGWSSAG